MADAANQLMAGKTRPRGQSDNQIVEDDIMMESRADWEETLV